jgi:Arc/MetJ-type ribon-helix-helix transcriptional regulator
MGAARHVYDNTQEQASNPDPARLLLVQWLVKNLSILNDDFDILASESELIRDLFREALKRATKAERKLAPLKRECAQKDKEIQKLKGGRCKKCKQSSFLSVEEDTWLS